jgi:hypothetical protein
MGANRNFNRVGVKDSPERKITTSSNLFLFKLTKFLVVLYSISTCLYLLTDENRLTDRNAKIFVSDLAQNSLVIHQPICEERREVFQRILKYRNRHFKYLFIGSSRIMQFGKHTGYEDGLNLGVSGAGLEDVLIVDSLRRNYGITCDSLFVDFNPWYVQSKTDERFLQFDEYENVKHALTHIFMFDHSINNLKTIPFSKKSNYQPFNTVKNPELFHIKNQDGSSIHKPISARKRNWEIEHFVKEMYQMKNFDSIQQSRMLIFKNWALKNSLKTPMTIILSPFHPTLFNQRITDQRVKNILVTENIVRSWNHANIQVVGTFYSGDGKYIDSDFYDGFHLTDEAVRTKL